jgi:2-haloacid dehalogenase
VGSEPGPPRPSAIAFDAYGTLLDLGSLAEACAAEVSERLAPRFVELWRQKQLEYTWLRALMDRYEDFWRVTADALDETAARLGVGLDDRAKARLMGAWLELRPYPEVPSALAPLAALGIPMFVVSNGSPAMLRHVLARAGLERTFSGVLSVDAVRTYKPADAVYAMAEREIGLPRESILFVSANGWDVAGAKLHGFRVAWVNRADGPADRLGVEPDAVVQDVTEIVRVVRASGTASARQPTESVSGG